MSTPTEEVSREKGEVSTDLTSNPMSTPTEDVSKEKGEVSTDLKSNPVSTPVGEVSREKRKVSTDLKSTVEEVSSEKGEVSTDLTSNPSLKMSTPTEDVSKEKVQVSTDLESNPVSTPVGEVSREKGKVSTDLKSTVEKLSAQLKESNYEDWIPRLTNLTKSVYNFADQHFPSTVEQKIADIEHQTRLCMEVLNSVPQWHRKSNRESAIFEYLKGRLFNAIPGVYKKEAEFHLEKSIKIDPGMWMAWHGLASCFIKKGEFNGAEKCYQTALKMAKGNTMILREYAAFQLKLSQVSKTPAYIEASIKYARRTLELDNNDGKCLYILGRAYFTSFLLTGGRDHNNLQLALQEYEQAKKVGAAKSNPYLKYDCSVVNRYLENYKMSLNGFSEAASMNPACDALHQRQLTLELLDNLELLLQGKHNDKNKGKSKGKSMESLVNIDLNDTYNVTVDLLTEGLNEYIKVVAEVQCLVKYEYKAPLYYMLSDSDENSFVLAVFGIQKEAIKQGDQVTLLNPICKFVDFVWEGKHYQFKSVRVNLLEQVLLNGNPLPPSSAMRESLL